MARAFGPWTLGLSLACAPSRTAPAAARSPEAEPRASESRSVAAPRPLENEADWCVSGGAALVGAPLVDADNRLYFASSDGTLHAFESDGRYRFAFTLEGIPQGALSLRPSDGTILLGTTHRHIYAISQSGVLSWRASTPTPVWSGIVLVDSQKLVYLGLDQHLYALGTGGRALFRVALPDRPLGDPVVGEGGRIWVPLQSGIARLVGAQTPRHIALGGAVQELLAWRGGVAARVGTELWILDAEGAVVERHPARTMGTGGGDLVFFDSPTSVTWLRPRGPLQLTVELPAEPSAAPVVFGDRVALPLQRGWLGWLDPRGRLELRRLGGAALGRPVPGQGRLFVPSADGRICALAAPPGPR